MSRRRNGYVVWLVVALLGLGGCAGRADLGERRVLAMVSALERAESRDAYGRASERSENLARGMSVVEAEATMGAFTAVETREGVDGKPLERRATVVEGKLCVRDISERRQRWLFGYDQDRVVFVGFAVEFERGDAGDDWELRRVDRQPDDFCESKG